jgi:hypothetical protein
MSVNGRPEHESVPALAPGRVQAASAEPPPKIWHTASDGTLWRVHDCGFVKGKFRALRTPSAHAAIRFFLTESGIKKSYRFTSRESRELTEPRLEAQLRAAELRPAAGMATAAIEREGG